MLLTYVRIRVLFHGFGAWAQRFATPRGYRYAGLTWIMLGIGVLSCSLLVQAHMYFNATTSMPIGWYQAVAIGADKVRRGDIVMACLPSWVVTYRQRSDLPLEPGTCPGGVTSVLKHVAALPGDRVRVTPRGVYINEVYWDHSTLHSSNSVGGFIPRPYLNRTTTVPPHRYWLLTHMPDSFDSRYFGPVTLLIARARPILTFPIGQTP